MSQKLSAMKYVRNNKRRTVVLIVSLGLCFALTYLTHFLLSTTCETYKPIAVENTKKIQYIRLAGSSLGIDVDRVSDEEFSVQYEEGMMDLADRLEGYDGVKQVYYAKVIYAVITPAVGNITVEIPLLSKEEIPEVLQHMDMALSEGRLPEKEGEVVVDSATMNNNGYEIGGYFSEDYYGETYTIVGILKGDSYFGCGIRADRAWENQWLVVLSEGIYDFSAVLHELGIDVRENYDSVLDYSWGKKELKDTDDVIGGSISYVYIGVMVLLFISLLVVYTSYLRDRHDEWCLYCSIGFSRKEIYFSILRELLFTYVTALLGGGVLIAAAVVLLNYAMIIPQGIRCRFFYPGTLGEILCSYVLLLGVLQIPIRYALYRIRTIDAMDDELY